MRGAQSGQFVIPAGGRVPVQGQGQFIRCLEADGQFFVSVNNGAELYFASGISFVAPAFEDYTEYALINKTGLPVTVIMAWGFGEVSDNRLTATGNLFVINAPATTLKVDDDETQVKLDSVLAMMQNSKNQRAPLNTLAGATYAGGTATGTILSAAANNGSGVIIRRALLTPSGSGTTCSIAVGGNAIMRATGLTSFAFNDNIEGVFVPPGTAITANVTGTANFDIWYEVLP